MGWLHVMADVQGGGYISAWKLIPLLVVVLIWARLMTWADNDAEAAHLPRIPFNVSFLAGLILAFFLFLYLPNFLFGILRCWSFLARRSAFTSTCAIRSSASKT